MKGISTEAFHITRILSRSLKRRNRATNIKMNKYFILVCLLFLGGCKGSETESDKNKDVGARPSTRSTKREVPRSSNREGITDDVQKSISRLRQGNDIIQNAKREVQSYRHVFLSEKAPEKYIKSALDIGNAKQLSDELKENTSIWVSDPQLKDVVIARLSLLTGIIGSPSEKTTPRLPELFSYQEHVTMEDVLTLRMIEQASRISTHRVKIEDKHMKSWKGLAASPNKIYRAISLVLFDLIDSTPEQTEEFYGVFEKEQDPDVLKLVTKKVKSQ